MTDRKTVTLKQSWGTAPPLAYPRDPISALSDRVWQGSSDCLSRLVYEEWVDRTRISRIRRKRQLLWNAACPSISSSSISAAAATSTSLPSASWSIQRDAARRDHPFALQSR